MQMKNLPIFRPRFLLGETRPAEEIGGIRFTQGQGGFSYLEDHPRYRKWLGSPPFISHEVRPFLRGPTTRSLGDLRLPWLLTTYPSPGMILQVLGTPVGC